MHEIIDKSFIWVQKLGTLFDKKWIIIFELLQEEGEIKMKSIKNKAKKIS
jgi:hypothetical protein